MKKFKATITFRYRHNGETDTETIIGIATSPEDAIDQSKKHSSNEIIKIEIKWDKE